MHNVLQIKGLQGCWTGTLKRSQDGVTLRSTIPGLLEEDNALKQYMHMAIWYRNKHGEKLVNAKKA